MNARDTLKRIWFETLFLFLLLPLMVYHMFLVYVLATWECFRIYPSEIHKLTIKLVYGEESS